MDDILVFGKSKEEHDNRLARVLRNIHEAGLTFNKEKCEFCKAELVFLGHVINQDGISADPLKTEAILISQRQLLNCEDFWV